MCSRQTSIAFFQTKNVAVGASLFKKLNLLTDKLKAGQHFNQSGTIVCRDLICHIRRNNGFDQSRIGRHGSCCLLLSEQIFRNQHTGHISGKGNVLSGFAVQSINSQTIRIRIRSQNDIRLLFFGQLQCQSKGLGILWIRIIYCWEISIRFSLFWNNIYIFKS